ncbi:hypothetical protein BD311DRAFT_756077 [Dichomitus squalens]|uniref:Uncharacterized protein n=1 Tax=Dichomitus squalens TaxID=114155 RepID=A0A4Q9MPR4_9APHY|nr:hypothetical protein BD311DRAFT_756077 [Dichomitus squalens]
MSDMQDTIDVSLALLFEHVSRPSSFFTLQDIGDVLLYASVVLPTPVYIWAIDNSYAE